VKLTVPCEFVLNVRLAGGPGFSQLVPCPGREKSLNFRQSANYWKKSRETRYEIMTQATEAGEKQAPGWRQRRPYFER
jgi:hypothetical protein